ncbi:MAG: DUF1540 domain-containing protein [Turicibacter sp.]|nr:DUF1540 domain-containing protein [Turicibacter sp.]
MLKCDSTDCLHNDKEGKCFAKHIAIDGRSAQTTAETVCSSYVSDHDFQNYEFAEDFMGFNATPANEQNITCAAQNCKYNVGQACVATKVKINSEDASCETFES